ncbi:hypothetical protein JCM10908_005008 [Rhodotorula pacifica]|uniref:transport protein particle complex II subunit TRS130 n=1 Tax=Rhodotorula pacifica TaxID=1495444 RepID=UPI00316E100F
MGKGVAVAYEALPVAADFESVRADVERHLPLRNLHWVRKSSANRTIRTIQTLPVHVRPREASHGATDLLDMPYLNLLFVVCDDNEVYRATLRTQIREWLDSITAKRHQEWLIVHVTTGRGSGGKFYQRKGTIVDKIKADFNVGKRDRCIQVVQGASADDPTSWADFLTKMKECVVTTFDANVALYEENIRKADSQRMLAGWQFLPFCRQKEALADSFEAMTLYEDALIQYDELEASFFQHVKEHGNATWFDRFGGLAPGDDALPLLSTSCKPYRKLIDTNTISVFDFRSYLFARQAFMLFRLDRVVEVARRGAYFVSTFARKLRENQATLGVNFVESWTYSACLDIVAACEAKLASQPTQTPSVALVAVKAELLELAKKQLDKLGIFAGHLPALHPFSMSLNESPSTTGSSSSTPPATTLNSPTRPPVTRRDLLDAIDQEEVFDSLYIDLTQKAIQAYQATTRRRCAAKLQACLAALDHERKRNSAAQKLLSQLSGQYTEQRWSSIEAYLHCRSAELQASLDMPREQLLSTLALVRAGVPVGGKTWNLDELLDDSMDRAAQSVALASKLMGDVHRLSSALTKDFAAVAFPTFAISLKPDSGARPQDEDGMTAVALVTSLLPCELKIDEVRLKLSTAEGEQIWATAGSCTLRPKEATPVTVFCPTSVTGRVTLELSQLRFSRIIFQYSHRAKPGDELALPPRLRQTLYLPADVEAVRITLEEPPAVHLDRERGAILCVDSGRNDVKRLAIRCSVEGQNVRLDLTRSEAIDYQGSTGVEDGALVLTDLKAYTPARLAVPLVGEIMQPRINVSISVEYTSAKRPQLRRTLRYVTSYSIALPLAVNVQDYFRQDCLLSKFSVTTDGTRGLIVKSAEIQAPAAVQVQACRSDSSKFVAISPLQTANFLFKLRCADPALITDPLRLVLTYTSEEQRTRSRIHRAVQRNLGDGEWRACRRWLADVLIADALISTTATPLGDKSVSVSTPDKDLWTKRFARCPVPAGREQALLAKVEEIISIISSGAVLVEDTWHSLQIPLELPALHVLNLVYVEASEDRVDLGQTVDVTITIRPTFRWRPDPHEGRESLKLAYSVIYNMQEWLVAGQVQGDFEAREGQEHALQLSLVPLVPGALFLPSLAIQPTEPPTPNSAPITCETQHVTAAAAIEVLPVQHHTTFEIPSSSSSYAETYAA